MTTAKVQNASDDYEYYEYDSSETNDAYQSYVNDFTPVLGILTILYAVILVIVIVTNAITFSQIAAKKYRNVKIITNPFVFTLTIADILWPVFNVPMNLVQTWTPYWLFGSVTCKIFPLVQLCFPDTIALTLCLIAIERYLAIVHPFKAKVMSSKRIAIPAIIGIIVVPIAINIVPSISHGLYETPGGNVCMVVDSGILSANFVEPYKVIQSTVLLLVIPILLFPFCYGMIVSKVFALKSTAERSSQLSKTLLSNERSGDPNLVALANATNQRLVRAEQRRFRVTLLSVGIQIAHFACWTPIVIFQLVNFLQSYPHLSPNEYICLRFLILLAAANPALNSFLYTAALYRDRHRRASTARNCVAANAKKANTIPNTAMPPVDPVILEKVHEQVCDCSPIPIESCAEQEKTSVHTDGVGSAMYMFAKLTRLATPTLQYRTSNSSNQEDQVDVLEINAECDEENGVISADNVDDVNENQWQSAESNEEEQVYDV